METGCIAELTDQERQELTALTREGTPRARTVTWARILLAADAGQLDKDAVAALSTSRSTVFRTRRRFVEAGLEHALHDRRRDGGARKLSGREEALLIATACSAPPDGRARWTLELLAGEMAA